MIWAILAMLGIPLWLCATGIMVLMMRNRAIRHRPGNAPVRRRRKGRSRWTRGHGVWVHDVFAFRGSPAAWAESLIPVREVVTAFAHRRRPEEAAPARLRPVARSVHRR